MNERSDSPTSYVNHSQESWALMLAFPHFAGILIEKAMRGDKDLLSSEQVLFGKPDKLKPIFQSLLLLRRHLQHNTVRTFIRSVNLMSPDEWNKVWRGNCSPEDVMEAEAPDFAGSTKAPIFAGYLRIYRLGLQMKGLFDALESDARIELSDLIKLRDRIREMLKWLVNLSSAPTTDRLATVQTEVVYALEEQARRDPNVSFALVSAIQKSIEESLSLIGIPMYVFA